MMRGVETVVTHLQGSWGIVMANEQGIVCEDNPLYSACVVDS